MSEQGLRAGIATMREAGVDEAAVGAFERAYRLCERGETGLIAEGDIEPLTEVDRLTDVEVPDADAAQALRRTVVIRLNGGLGTSMGLDRAKTLLPVRDGRTFLDLIVAQVCDARQTHDARLPLLLMNSFRTSADTLDHLAAYPDLATDGLPLEFLQNRVPRLLVEDLTPVRWPRDPTLEWCPPGHGDVYAALWQSGILTTLLDAGYRYANVGNGDNLGARPDATLAGWFAASGAHYAAEVCERTANDRKGGHLARRRADGRTILRDSAQTSAADERFFADETRHPYFHANNIWLHLPTLHARLAASGGVLPLPLIRNVKRVDPHDPGSPEVVQLESSIGSAIELFDDVAVIAVPRDRFLPVKTTNELLLLRSDVFDVGADGAVRATGPIPRVRLADRYYRSLADFDRRFRVVPALAAAGSLTVEGDWTFDAPLTVEGDLVLPDSGFPRRVGEHAADPARVW